MAQPTDKLVQNSYELARERYALLGVNTGRRKRQIQSGRSLWPPILKTWVELTPMKV
jgi:hypothetical protein